MLRPVRADSDEGNRHAAARFCAIPAAAALACAVAAAVGVAVGVAVGAAPAAAGHARHRYPMPRPHHHRRHRHHHRGLPGVPCRPIHSPFTHDHRERVVKLRGVECRTANLVANAFNHRPADGRVQKRGFICFRGRRPEPWLFLCAKGERGVHGPQGWRHAFEVYRL
jgi:hypothetical protein